MAWETAEPPPSDRAETARIAPSEGAGAGGKDERFGAVAIERRVKEDGRALILYDHRGEAQP